ncbi:MAG: type II toxin-antitoxin system VapC family toxin [Rhizomicrobium sp.]
MILLDTNVMSEFTRPLPSPDVVEWFRTQSPANLGTTAINEAEILAGLVTLPEGRRKIALIQETEAMLSIFGPRVFSFDRDAARIYPLVVLERKAFGLATDTADGQIAAIARAQGAVVATRNTTDFEHCGVEVINPWNP